MGLGDWEPGSLGEGCGKEDHSRSKLQQRGVSGEVQRRREDMELYAACFWQCRVNVNDFAFFANRLACFTILSLETQSG